MSGISMEDVSLDQVKAYVSKVGSAFAIAIYRNKRDLLAAQNEAMNASFGKIFRLLDEEPAYEAGDETAMRVALELAQSHFEARLAWYEKAIATAFLMNVQGTDPGQQQHLAANGIPGDLDKIKSELDADD